MRYNYKILVNALLKSIRKKKTVADDFDWEVYNTQYRKQVIDISKEHIQVLRDNDYIFDNNTLKINNRGILPLHPNHRLLYETILQLNPASVFELGCGCGDHLHNIDLLCNNMELYGVDISGDQLAFLRERHPNLNASVDQYDCTLPFPLIFPKVDVAYTQAVLMHIQTGNGHMIALSNLFSLATKQIVLMENWTRHEFMKDINRLYALKVIPWKEVYFYYRDSEELKRPHIMIVSSLPLNQYKPLTDFGILRDNVAAD